MAKGIPRHVYLVYESRPDGCNADDPLKWKDIYSGAYTSLSSANWRARDLLRQRGDKWGLGRNPGLCQVDTRENYDSGGLFLGTWSRGTRGNLGYDVVIGVMEVEVLSNDDEYSDEEPKEEPTDRMDPTVKETTDEKNYIHTDEKDPTIQKDPIDNEDPSMAMNPWMRRVSSFVLPKKRT